MKHIALTLAAILLTGCASMTPRERAQAGVGADLATTAVGLSVGLVEANPLGILTIPLSFAVIEHCDTLPEVEAASCHHQNAAVREGLAVNNALLIAGKLLSTVVNPYFALAAGAAWAINRWSDGAAEREFSELCATHKALAGNPSLRCVFAASGDR